MHNYKSQLEDLSRDIEKYKQMRAEYERKLQLHLREIETISKTYRELEVRQTTLRRNYEEELHRLNQSPQHKQQEQPKEKVKESDQTSPNRSKLPPINSQIPLIAPSIGFASISFLGKRIMEDPRPPTQKIPFLNVAPSSTESKQEEIIHPETPSKKVRVTKHKSPETTPVNKSNQSSKSRVAYNHQLPQHRIKISFDYDLEHSSVVCCVRYSNDGEYLATGSNRKAQIFSATTGKRHWILSDGNENDGDSYLRSVCFSPDGQYLACGAEDKTVKIWNIEQQKIYHVFEGHKMDIYSVDYSNDSRLIVSGSGDKKARIWDVERKKCLHILGNDEVGPKDGVTSVCISPDGRLIAAGSLDRIVRLWDAQTGYFLERYEGHSDSVYSVAFSPDGKSLASGSLDKTLKLWDLSESRSRSRCRNSFSGHSDFVLSVAFSPDGNWLVSGSKDRTIHVWDPRNVIAYATLFGHANSVISVAVSDKSIASGSGDNLAKIWKYKPSQFPMTA